jgi:hypothetical protein
VRKTSTPDGRGRSIGDHGRQADWSRARPVIGDAEPATSVWDTACTTVPRGLRGMARPGATAGETGDSAGPAAPCETTPGAPSVAGALSVTSTATGEAVVR